MDSYADRARRALLKLYGTLWKAALAYSDTWSGGRLVTELSMPVVDKSLEAFIEKQTGVKP